LSAKGFRDYDERPTKNPRGIEKEEKNMNTAAQKVDYQVMKRILIIIHHPP
jgi:hypothetical protein